MLRIRPAALQDLPLIVAHRRAMFAEISTATPALLDRMSANFAPWLAHTFADGRYLGWVATVDEAVAGSAGYYLLEWPPHVLDPENSQRGYLLNFWIEPAFRRQGIAHRLLQAALDENRRRGLRVAALHASNAGRPLYEAFGFKPTNEMFLVTEQ